MTEAPRIITNLMCLRVVPTESNTDSSQRTSSSSADTHSNSSSSSSGNDGDSSDNGAAAADDIGDGNMPTNTSSACISEDSATGTYCTIYTQYHILH
jgi:hypothetical protein